MIPASHVVIRTILFVIFFVSSAFGIEAQAQGVEVFKGFRVGGSVGVAGEAYTVSGIPNRRAPFLGRANASLSFNLFGLTSGINLIYSTDESKIRQSINRLAFSTRYKFLNVAVGGVSPSFSKYSLSGVVVRGGLIQATPKKLEMSFTAGQSRRATSGSTEDAFRGQSNGQNLYATRLGYGKQGGTYVHVTGLYGRDREPEEATSTFLPASNYVVAPAMGLALFRGKVKIEGGLTASVYNRNSDTPTTETRNPALFGLIPLQATSQLAYAGESSFQMNLKSLRLLAGYERIEQGFETMGLTQVRDDQAVIRFIPQIRIGQKLQMRLNYQNRHNNLNQTRQVTTQRQQMGGTISTQPWEWLGLTASYDLNTSQGESGANRVATQNVNTWMFSPNLTLEKGETAHTLVFSGSYQTLSDERETLVTHTDNLNTSVNYSLSLPKKRTVSASGNWLRSHAPQIVTTATGLQAGVGFPLLREKLTMNFSLNWSKNSTETEALDVNTPAMTISGQQAGLTLNANYKLPWEDALQLMLRGLNSQQDATSGGGTGQSFREMQLSIQYNHTF